MEVGRDAAIATTLICGVVVYFIVVAENHTFNQTILGIICNIFTVLFFSSPLASMVRFRLFLPHLVHLLYVYI